MIFLVLNVFKPQAEVQRKKAEKKKIKRDKEFLCVPNYL